MGGYIRGAIIFASPEADTDLIKRDPGHSGAEATAHRFRTRLRCQEFSTRLGLFGHPRVEAVKGGPVRRN